MDCSKKRTDCRRLGRGITADQQDLLFIKIKVLMGDHITKAHRALPVDLWTRFVQPAWLEFVEPFDRFAHSHELHTDHIK